MIFSMTEGEGCHPVVITNARIVTPSGIGPEECIVLQNGRIDAIGSMDDMQIPHGTDIIDASGRCVAPGFVDLHVHGGAGVSFNESPLDRFDGAVEHHVAHGTTSLLATLYVDEESKLIDAIERLACYIIQQGAGSVIKGIHLEGPFINPRKSGAMNSRFAWEPSREKWLLLRDAAKGMIRMMTVAPELPGILPVMRAAMEAGVTLSLGHSVADYRTIEEGIANGLTQVTHVFNAMNPMHHRRPGAVVASLMKRELKTHLIADGAHVHPAVMRLLYDVKGVDGVILITDAVAADAEGNGICEMAGKTVRTRNGQVCLSDGTLAGSTLTMSGAVSTMVRRVGVPLNEAVSMAALNPATVMGLNERKGQVAIGKDADLVILDADGGIRMTLVGGRVSRDNVAACSARKAAFRAPSEACGISVPL